MLDWKESSKHPPEEETMVLACWIDPDDGFFLINYSFKGKRRGPWGEEVLGWWGFPSMEYIGERDPDWWADLNLPPVIVPMKKEDLEKDMKELF